MRTLSTILAWLLVAGCAPADPRPEPAAAPASAGALLGVGDAAAVDGGITVSTALERTSASSAVLRVALSPRPGFRLAKSPPNEVHVDLAEGVTTPANPALLGEAFRGADAGDVVYYEGGAVVEIPLALSVGRGGEPLAVDGLVVYRACDDIVKVCTRREHAFAETASAL